MSPRIGRPKLDNPKDVDLKVRLDSETAKELFAYCELHNLTRAEAMRKGLKLLLSQNSK